MSTSVAQIDATVGTATGEVYDQMTNLLQDASLKPEDKAAQLLTAQAELSFVQGASHAIGQAYSMTGRIGQ
jgi:hypothetical protein